MNLREALYDLLCELFDAAHLRLFLRHGEQGEIVARALPGDRASLGELVDEAVTQLLRHGLVTATLTRLYDEFPRRRADIAPVAALWSEAAQGQGGRCDPGPVAENGVVITPEVYFRAWLDPARGHHHCWTMVGREALSGEILAAILDGRYPVILLEGRGGIGKSRVLLELSRTLVDGGLRVFVYQGDASVRVEQLAALPTDRALLLFDDAHRLLPEELRRISEFAARQRPDLVLLFACRPNGYESIVGACAAVGRGPDAVFHRVIPNLGEAARIALATQALGSEHDPTVLARLFPDAPLFIVVGGSLVRSGSISIEQLRRSDDLRKLVLSHFPFKPLLSERDASIRDEHMHAVLGTASLLAQRSSRDLPWIEELSGLEREVATRASGLLFDLGILDHVNDRLVILPDLYGSYATLAWLLPHDASLGRVHALWTRLREHHHRYVLLRNFVELTRVLATPAQKEQLRFDLVAIWTECEESLRRSPEAARTDGYLELMAPALAPEAIGLAERLMRDMPDGSAPPLSVELAQLALQGVDVPGIRLRVRAIDLLVRAARDPEGKQARQALRELAHDLRFADEVSGAVEDAVADEACSAEFIRMTIELLTIVFRTKRRAWCRGESTANPLLDHGRIGARLVALVFTRPAPILSEALRALATHFVVVWDGWARQHGVELEASNASVLTLLNALRVGLSAEGDGRRRFAARRALREAAGAVGSPLSEAILALIRDECEQLGPGIDALDPSFVPLEVHERRLQEQPREGYPAEIEGIRGRAMQRFLGCAPDLEGLIGLGNFGEVVARLLVTDSLLDDPVSLLQRAETWTQASVDRSIGTDALRQALVHYFSAAPVDGDSTIRHFYEVTRLDEAYAVAIARHSEAMGAIGTAHALMLRELPHLLGRASETARLLLAESEDPAALWRRLLQLREEVPSSEDPRLYALLYALVGERPALAGPLARDIVESGLGSNDTIAPVLQALRRHDPAAARTLALELVGSGASTEAPLALVVATWIGGPEDERELLRALIACKDKAVTKHAYAAAGVLMAVRPAQGREFLAGPHAPGDAAQLGAWMEGFLNGQFALGYPPAFCPHIDELLAPCARDFAAEMIHPHGASDMEVAAEKVGTRLTRFVAGAGPPTWDEFPEEFVPGLVRDIVLHGAVGHSACQTFLVASVNRWPQLAFEAFVEALMAKTPLPQFAPALVQAMVRPLVENGRIDGVVDVLLNRARRERSATPVGLATPTLAAAGLLRFKPFLIARIEQAGDDEELLLDIGHLLRKLDLLHLVVHAQIVALLGDDASPRSPRYFRRFAQMLADIDLKQIELKIRHWEAARLEACVDIVQKVRAPLRETSMVGALYRELHELVLRCATRARREAEA